MYNSNSIAISGAGVVVRVVVGQERSNMEMMEGRPQSKETAQSSKQANHIAVKRPLVVTCSRGLLTTNRSPIAARGDLECYLHILSIPAQKTPTCCVSLSSFYNDTIVNCPTCTCGCRNKTAPGSCVDPDSTHLASVVSGKPTDTPCPVLQPHVSDSSALACEAKLQGVLEDQDHNHKFQLQNELHTMEPCRAAPEF
ncbi:COBRA-like protein [Arachis hypogaea]|nr:COBRA-like protein [Arachis hypogaea]